MTKSPTVGEVLVKQAPEDPDPHFSANSPQETNYIYYDEAVTPSGFMFSGSKSRDNLFANQGTRTFSTQCHFQKKYSDGQYWESSIAGANQRQSLHYLNTESSN